LQNMQALIIIGSIFVISTCFLIENEISTA
jgi:hypothetical protein